MTTPASRRWLRPALFVLAGLVAAAAGLWFQQRTTAASAAVEAAPELVLTTLDGERRRLAEYRGQLVLVNFWATWCAPCLKEIPLLVKLQAEYAGRGLQLLGPALDDPVAVRNALPRLGIRYPVFADDREVAAAMTALGDTLGALPYSVLIDAGGRIVARKHGEFEEAELRALLEPHLP
ncbi:MAG TPA: TlpA disulfide reductase family protein [Nevskiaceae bacterium]|nr:TlpA disulfide reductase family protein [Nevskiaceae bacterium]